MENSYLQKIAPHLLFFLLPYLIYAESPSECTKEIRNRSYLDMAVEMIHKAKDTNFVCSQVKVEPLDCADVLDNGHNHSGVFRVFPKNRVLNGKPIEVFCDMETDDGGWTVIQRRGNFLRPKLYFFQDWEAYKKGFGDIEEDFWLGNDNIFALSNQKLYSIRFDLGDVEGNKRFAVYDTFWIDDEDHKYTLHIEGYRGDAGDSITVHNNRSFTTKDRDNDRSAEKNCAESFKGAWWYGSCYSSNLNGEYLRGKQESSGKGVLWNSWKGNKESMDTTEIKIRPKDFRKSTLLLSATPQ